MVLTILKLVAESPPGCKQSLWKRERALLEGMNCLTRQNTRSCESKRILRCAQVFQGQQACNILVKAEKLGGFVTFTEKPNKAKLEKSNKKNFRPVHVSPRQANAQEAQLAKEAKKKIRKMAFVSLPREPLARCPF